MNKFLYAGLILLIFSYAAFAEEEGGHEEKKPPPKPSSASPVEQVLELPVVKQWTLWMETHEGHVRAWGEFIKEIKGEKYWDIAVGEQRHDGVEIWRKFSVPQSGGDILVQNVTTSPDDEITYNSYAKWVTECKPTVSTGGNC